MDIMTRPEGDSPKLISPALGPLKLKVASGHFLRPWPGRGAIATAEPATNEETIKDPARKFERESTKGVNEGNKVKMGISSHPRRNSGKRVPTGKRLSI